MLYYYQIALEDSQWASIIYMAGIDPTLIREALQRRATGALSGGSTMPISGQVSAPGGATPTGGANTPTTPPPTAPQTPGSTANLGKVVKGAQATGGPAFDDETKKISKALISNLIKYL